MIVYTGICVCGSRQAGAGKLVLGATHQELHLLMPSRALLLETEVGMETSNDDNDGMPQSGINETKRSMMEAVTSTCCVSYSFHPLHLSSFPPLSSLLLSFPFAYPKSYPPVLSSAVGSECVTPGSRTLSLQLVRGQRVSHRT